MKLLVSSSTTFDHGYESADSEWAQNFFIADQVVVAVGYVTHDSLVYLSRLVELNPDKSFILCIGLARIEGLTKNQKEACARLDHVLRNGDRGGVFVAYQVPFHAKATVFSKDGIPTQAIVGSSNLGALTPPKSQFEPRHMEIDVALSEPDVVNQLAELINDLVAKYSVEYSRASPSLRTVAEQGHILLEGSDVEQVSVAETRSVYVAASSAATFHIPLKPTEKSNLNVFFGEGRKNPQGYVRPRNWYEVELIVPKSVTSQSDYPRGDFLALTDDGYLFTCKTSGDYHKNFRSRSDLTVLGRWLKGRMEASGALAVGDPVTGQTLADYGRASLELKQTGLVRDFDGESLPLWILDFSQPGAS